MPAPTSAAVPAPLTRPPRLAGLRRLTSRPGSGVRALAALVTCLACTLAHASAIEQLREFASSTRSAQGQFSQRTLKSTGQAAEASGGTFAFARPGRFRWEVKKPFEQLLVADGEKVYFYDKDLNQVTERPIGEAVGATPAAILFGDGNLEKSFELRDAGVRDGLEWLEAIPRSRDAGFEKIAIGMQNGLPQAMEVLDAFGRRTIFSFSAVQRNPRLDADLFRFVVPKGADVVKQ